MRETSLLATFVFLIGAVPLDAKVDAMFSRWSQSTPGVVVAASKGKSIVLQRAYGSADLRFRLPMRVDDRFNVGSIAKQFTAFAIYELVASRRIASVDDPIGKYVPGLSSLVASVTIRDLLEHTSGLRDYFALAQMSGITLEDSLDTDAVVRFANAQQRTDFPPGTDYEYSNTNYVLLAEAVRFASGMSLGAYLHERVFGPLHMDHTQLVTAHGTPLDNLVSSYWPNGNGGFVQRDALLDIQGDGNLITTAGDLLTWEDNIDTKALGGAVIDGMLERGKDPGSRPADTRFVNGLTVESFAGFERVSSDGGIAGFRAIAMTIPARRVSVVALTNLITTFPDDEVDAIASSLLGRTAPAASSAPPPPAKTSPVATGLQEYVGRYAGAEIDSTYSICPSDSGNLVVRQLRTSPVPLHFLGGDHFTGNFWWLTDVEFLRSGGRVTAMAISGRSAHGIRLERVADSCTMF